MFPTHCNMIQGLAPEVYFGGSPIPSYHEVRLITGTSIEEIVLAIRRIAKRANANGYIDGDRIKYHFDTSGEIQIDRSKGFIFLADLRQEAEHFHPSAFTLLQFLQDPCRRALIVTRGRALLLEKTPETYSLCVELDRIWERLNLPELLQDSRGGAFEMEKLLTTLMKKYEEKNCGESTEMWGFWEMFRDILMTQRLRLSIRTVVA